MRRLRAILPCLLAVALGGCQAFPPSSGSARLQRILADGELRVGLSGNQAPLNMHDRRGNLIGLEVDLVTALAGSMGVTPRFVEKPFAQLLPALERGEVDLVISGVTITPARNARVAFAGPYFISGKSLLTGSVKIADAESLAALDEPTHRYAVLEGSTSEVFARQTFPRAERETVSDYDAGVQMVIDGKAHALIADFPVCRLSVSRYPDAGLHTPRQPFTTEPLGIALRAGDPLFVNLVQNYLSTLENTGQLAAIKARWFSDGPWLAELP
jgi:polar amino acid transport system substrate-binding protein